MTEPETIEYAQSLGREYWVFLLFLSRGGEERARFSRWHGRPKHNISVLLPRRHQSPGIRATYDATSELENDQLESDKKKKIHHHTLPS